MATIRWTASEPADAAALPIAASRHEGPIIYCARAGTLQDRVPITIEPGIYLPEFGVRSEVNMLIRPNAAQVTGRIQSELVII